MKEGPQQMISKMQGQEHRSGKVLVTLKSWDGGREGMKIKWSTTGRMQDETSCSYRTYLARCSHELL